MFFNKPMNVKGVILETLRYSKATIEKSIKVRYVLTG